MELPRDFTRPKPTSSGCTLAGRAAGHRLVGIALFCILSPAATGVAGGAAQAGHPAPAFVLQSAGSRQLTLHSWGPILGTQTAGHQRVRVVVSALPSGIAAHRRGRARSSRHDRISGARRARTGRDRHALRGLAQDPVPGGLRRWTIRGVVWRARLTRNQLHSSRRHRQCGLPRRDLERATRAPDRGADDSALTGTRRRLRVSAAVEDGLRDDDRFEAAFDVKLAQDRRNVRFDRELLDVEVGGDLTV
jgi:hypothetical protein